MSKLKKRLDIEISRLKNNPESQFTRSRMLDDMAFKVCTMSRAYGETDEELFARLAAHPDFDRFKDEISAGVPFLINKPESSFMEDLKKI